MKLLFAPLLAGMLCLTTQAGAQETPAASAATAVSTESSPTPDEPAEDASEPTSEESAQVAQPARSRATFSPYASLSDEALAYEYQHTSLGGPVALTVVGGSISVLALPTFLLSGVASLVCAANDVADCTAIDTLTVVSGALTVVFGTMTIVGVVLLSNRSQTRTALKNEIWRRQAEGASLTLGLAPTRGGLMLTLGGQF